MPSYWCWCCCCWESPRPQGCRICNGRAADERRRAQPRKDHNYNFRRLAPAAVENNPHRREEGRSRTCLQRRRKGSRQSFSRKPRAHIGTRAPVVVTSAPLLPPTPSTPCIRCRRDYLSRKRAAVRSKFAPAEAAATARRPHPGPGCARPKDEAGCSRGHVLRKSGLHTRQALVCVLAVVALSAAPADAPDSNAHPSRFGTVSPGYCRSTPRPPPRPAAYGPSPRVCMYSWKSP